MTGFVLVIMLFRFELFRNNHNDFLQKLNKVFVGNEMKITTRQDIDVNKIKINLILKLKNQKLIIIKNLQNLKIFIQKLIKIKKREFQF